MMYDVSAAHRRIAAQRGHKDGRINHLLLAITCVEKCRFQPLGGRFLNDFIRILNSTKDDVDIKRSANTSTVNTRVLGDLKIQFFNELT